MLQSNLRFENYSSIANFRCNSTYRIINATDRLLSLFIATTEGHPCIDLQAVLLYQVTL